MAEMHCKREFWRLIGAFDHLKQYESSGDVLPYDNYPPIGVEVGQAFVIDYYRKEDGAVTGCIIWRTERSGAICRVLACIS